MKIARSKKHLNVVWHYLTLEHISGLQNQNEKEK